MPGVDAASLQAIVEAAFAGAANPSYHGFRLARDRAIVVRFVWPPEPHRLCFGPPSVGVVVARDAMARADLQCGACVLFDAARSTILEWPPDSGIDHAILDPDGGTIGSIDLDMAVQFIESMERNVEVTGGVCYGTAVPKQHLPLTVLRDNEDDDARS